MSAWLSHLLVQLAASPPLQGLVAALSTFVLEDPTTIGCGLLVADQPAETFTERLASAVAELLGDGARLARMSAEAVAWSQRFDWDSSADRMAEAITALRRE